MKMSQLYGKESCWQYLPLLDNIIKSVSVGNCNNLQQMAIEDP